MCVVCCVLLFSWWTGVYTFSNFVRNVDSWYTCIKKPTKKKKHYYKGNQHHQIFSTVDSNETFYSDRNAACLDCCVSLWLFALYTMYNVFMLNGVVACYNKRKPWTRADNFELIDFYYRFAVCFCWTSM